MAFAIVAGRHPKFPTHQPITKSMYFLPRESVRMLPFVAATCSSAGRSLARGSRRRAGINDPFRAEALRLHDYPGSAHSRLGADPRTVLAVTRRSPAPTARRRTDALYDAVSPL